jgi:hypothetical protein
MSEEVKMRHNMGSVDRLLRGAIVAPGAAAAAVILGPATAGGIVLLVVSAVMLATAAVGFCPLYAALRISTCRRRTAGA